MIRAALGWARALLAAQAEAAGLREQLREERARRAEHEAEASADVARMRSDLNHAQQALAAAEGAAIAAEQRAGLRAEDGPERCRAAWSVPASATEQDRTDLARFLSRSAASVLTQHEGPQRQRYEGVDAEAIREAQALVDALREQVRALCETLRAAERDLAALRGSR